jgi:DNA-binding transcriptional regulator GbsR (MarR family)
VSSVDVFASAISSALETVLRKVGEGKKLSTEDLVVLMLGLFQEIRKDITETNKRIDALYELMGKNYEALNRRIEETNKRIDETNKRIDTLYDLLGKIYEVLIKGTTTQRQ